VRIHPGDTVLTPLEFRRYPITHSLAGGVGWGLALIGWLIPPWGSWIDRTRRSDLA
jgi:hypothetical protein